MRVQPAQKIVSTVLAHAQQRTIAVNLQKATYAQKVFDSLAKRMNLPSAHVTPGTKGHLVLNVHSAAKASLLRSQINRIEQAMQAKMGPIKLRIRNRPPLANLRTKKYLVIPNKHVQQLRFVAHNITHPALKRSVQKLVEVQSSLSDTS